MNNLSTYITEKLHIKKGMKYGDNSDKYKFSKNEPILEVNILGNKTDDIYDTISIGYGAGQDIDIIYL